MDRQTQWRTALIGLPLLMIVTGFGYYLTLDSEDVPPVVTGPVVNRDRPEPESAVPETSRPKPKHEELAYQSGERKLSRNRSPDPPDRRRPPKRVKAPVQKRKPKRAA